LQVAASPQVAHEDKQFSQALPLEYFPLGQAATQVPSLKRRVPVQVTHVSLALVRHVAQVPSQFWHVQSGLLPKEPSGH
jgi:hypothetical protein